MIFPQAGVQRGDKEHTTTYLKFQTRQSLLPLLNLVTHSVHALVVRVSEYEIARDRSFELFWSSQATNKVIQKKQ